MRRVLPLLPLLFSLALPIPSSGAITRFLDLGLPDNLPAVLRTETLSHNFNDGELDPFYPCTVQQPNYVIVENDEVKTYWTSSSLDSGNYGTTSRTKRGAEFCDAKRGENRASEMRTRDEGAMGFTVRVDTSHSRTSYSALAQVFGFDDAREDYFSWAGLLELQQGSLIVRHRHCMCDGTTATIAEDFEFGTDYDIVIDFKVSGEAKKGWFKVYIDGRERYSATNIRFGLGEFDDNDVQVETSYTTFKLGMYNHNSDDYTKDEVRIVYYDNVTWYNGKDRPSPGQSVDGESDGAIDGTLPAQSDSPVVVSDGAIDDTLPVQSNSPVVEPYDLENEESANSDTLSHNFDDGELDPFYPCTVQQPNYVIVENDEVKTYWTSSGLDPGNYNTVSRTKRGAEFCDAKRGENRASEMRTRDEGAMGFTVRVDTSHSRTSYSALAQVFGFDDAREDYSSWAGLLELQKGSLIVRHRYCMCDGTTATIVDDLEFEFGTDYDIFIDFKVSGEAKMGWFKVYIDGQERYSATNIRFGLGEFDDNDVQVETSYTTFKLGMNNHNPDDYTKDEERIVYYDNVTWYSGKDRASPGQAASG